MREELRCFEFLFYRLNRISFLLILERKMKTRGASRSQSRTTDVSLFFCQVCIVVNAKHLSFRFDQIHDLKSYIPSSLFRNTSLG